MLFFDNGDDAVVMWTPGDDQPGLIIFLVSWVVVVGVSTDGVRWFAFSCG